MMGRNNFQGMQQNGMGGMNRGGMMNQGGMNNMGGGMNNMNNMNNMGGGMNNMNKMNNMNNMSGMNNMNNGMNNMNGGMNNMGGGMMNQGMMNQGMNNQGMMNQGGMNNMGGRNFLPRIKEEGLPPNYNLRDYQFMEPHMLNCDLCKKKNLWDGESYISHIMGRTHNEKVEALVKEETELVASVREQLQSKTTKITGDFSKCKMCKTKYKGSDEEAHSAHKRSAQHKTMKRFIHPKCMICNCNFEMRSDWIYHRFSAIHLQNVAMQGNNQDGVSTLEDLKDFAEKLGGKKKAVGSAVATKAAIPEGKKIVNAEAIAVPKEKMEAMCKDVDLTNEEFDGGEHVKPLSGFYCKLCNFVFASGKDVVKKHCTGPQHMKKAGAKRKGGDSSGPKAKKAKN